MAARFRQAIFDIIITANPYAYNYNHQLSMINDSGTDNFSFGIK